jgi:serine/threonine protein kinase
VTPATIRFRGQAYPILDTLRLGRRDYAIVKKLSGGLRERYQVFDSTARDFRAVTVLPNDPGNHQHLKSLRKLANRNSANFPMVLEFHRKDGHTYVVQAWIRGHDLARKIRHAERYPATWPTPFEAFQIYRRLAHGLTQIHRETGLVHGDIKPADLVLLRNRVFLVDFGSAWPLEQTRYREPGDGFTAAYASPEQHRGDSFIDFRSDYFSASVIAYQLLTRQIPYDGLGGKAGQPQYGSAFVDKFVLPSRLAQNRASMRAEFWHAMDRIMTAGLALDVTARIGRY